MGNKKSFVFGVPVTGYNYVGLEEECRRLKADFTHGINVILMSPRRIGKTLDRLRQEKNTLLAVTLILQD